MQNLLVETDSGTTFGEIREGLQGNYDIVVRMVELTRNGAIFDKGFERFIKQLLRQNDLDSYSSPETLFSFLYNFTQKHVTYILDAVGNVEFLKTARETLSDGFGDCDDHAVLNATILAVLGFEPCFVLARYSVDQETYGHIYVVTYVNDKRFVFDTTIDNGKLNQEHSAVTTKEISLYDNCHGLDGVSGVFRQSARFIKDGAKSAVTVAPSLLGLIPFGFGYGFSKMFDAGTSLISNTFKGKQTYNDRITAVNRQLDSIIRKLHNGQITINEARDYAKKQYARLVAESAFNDSVKYDERMEKNVKAKFDAIVGFESYANANGIDVFSLDGNKMLVAGVVVLGLGYIFFKDG